jgi:hypothetical protein
VEDRNGNQAPTAAHQNIFNDVTPENVQATTGTLELINARIGQVFQGRIERPHHRTRRVGNIGRQMRNPLLEDFDVLFSSANAYDCMVHSLLTVGCSNFRGLSQEDKNIVARAFRNRVIVCTPQYLAKYASEAGVRRVFRYVLPVDEIHRVIPILPPGDVLRFPPLPEGLAQVDIELIRELRGRQQVRGGELHRQAARTLPADFNIEYRLRTPGIFLDGDDLTRICNFLAIQIQLFDSFSRLITNIGDGGPTYMMHNNGSHYEGVVKNLYRGDNEDWVALNARQMQIFAQAPALLEEVLENGEWKCPVCTLNNLATAKACAACGTLRASPTTNVLNVAAPMRQEEGEAASLALARQLSGMPGGRRTRRRARRAKRASRKA